MPTLYSTHDDAISQLTPLPYEGEAVLQQLIAEHPQLLAGDSSSGAAPRFLLVQREAGIEAEADGASRWSLDHLFLDGEGVPTLVEVKRAADTRIRREVVGQMLDYAANLTAWWTTATIRDRFVARIGKEDAADELVCQHGDVEDAERFWARVDANLVSHRLRLVFLADEIPSELARIIEFLNDQMDRTEVFGLSVARYAGPDGGSALLSVDRIGDSEAARAVKGSRSRGKVRSWTEPEVLETIAEHAGTDVASRVRTVVDGAKRAGYEVLALDNQTGSLVLRLPRTDDTYVYVGKFNNRGELQWDFHRLALTAEFGDPARLRELADRVGKAADAHLDDDALAGKPRVDIQSPEAIIDVLVWAAQQRP